ncbi:hypothetical protein TSAR_014689 [Trichomalopsis sarcophagae]|uniref:Uncharacterized protein n=1 Tax=Trichomalopsis sarcophagae TaxID=543379 RepID=A0A232EN03_9HYME|nr:hypothetical protein TSAR_014689 [Trichomalopsis sarcophagae]
MTGNARFLRCLILLLIAFRSSDAGESTTLSTASTIGGIATKIVNIINHATDGVRYLNRKLSDPAYKGDNTKRLIDQVGSNVLDELRYLSQRRDQFRVDVENFKNNVISKIDKVVPALVELNRRFSVVFVDSMNVDKAYDTFYEYLKNPGKYKSDVLVKFALDSVAEDNCGLLHLLTEIDSLLTLEETSTPSTIKLLNQHIQLFLRLTNVAQSPQQFLYNFLVSVLYTQMKAYITMKYSFEVLESHETVAVTTTIISGLITAGVFVAKQVRNNERRLSDPAHRGENVRRLFDRLENNVLDQLQYLSKRRDQFKIDVEHYKNEEIEKITENIPPIVELLRRLSVVFVDSITIDKSYDSFLEYLTKPEKYNRDMILKFAMDSLSENNCGLKHLITEIRTLLLESAVSSPSALTLFVRNSELFFQQFEFSQSPQQFLHNLLISLLLTETKAYLTMRFSYDVLELYSKKVSKKRTCLSLNHVGQYSGHIKRLEQDVAIRINKTISTFKLAMANVPREIWENNPPQHEEDVTFTELKNVFQSYVINEADFKNDGSCGNTCKDFKLALAAVDCYYDKEFCNKHQRCSGILHDCVHQFDEEMFVCLEEKNSTRRYQYIDVGYQRYGLEDQKCSSKAIELDRHYSSHNMAYCDPCMCLCDDDAHPKTERYFSLIPSIAAVKENYVLTGARLVKLKRTIHIQIQQGKLLPYGHVNESTVEWVPIKVDVLAKDEIYKIKWLGSRTVFLDDIEVPRNNVVVGLGFKALQQNNIKVLRLVAYSAPMNYSAGVLTDDTYERHSSEESSDEVDLKDLDIPTRRSSRIVQKSTNHQYVKFRTTSLLSDVGQSTIPFLDTQSVTTNPASPMSGAGIYHRRSPGDGGFLALKLFTFNVEPELRADIVDTQLELNGLWGNRWFVQSDVARMADYRASGFAGEMFSLRDASSSSGNDEDSFGWWIGVESRPSKSESELQPSSDCPSSATASTDDSALRARDLSQTETTVSADEEQIELRSLDGAEAALDSGFGSSNSEARIAVCYTPERLVKSEDFRIVTPSPTFYPTLADLVSSRLASSKAFRSLPADSWLSDGKIECAKPTGVEHLAALLRSPYYESSSSSRSSCGRCCCIRYGGGEVLLHTERCPRNDEERVDPEQEREPVPLFSSTPVTENKDQQLADDTSGVSSVSCSATEEDDEDRLPRRLSDELAYVSFEYALAARESQGDKTSDINEVVSILAGLDSDPRRVEELLLDEDRFREATQSGHDSLTRLALAIEPDVLPIIPIIKVNSSDDRGGGVRSRHRYMPCHAETELEQLRERIERLQGSSKDLHQDISSLRRDFTIDEWKVNHLSEDINKLRTEVYELRYLDDLLKLLKGELERIANRNWPFTVGRTKHGTEEINLVV